MGDVDKAISKISNLAQAIDNALQHEVMDKAKEVLSETIKSEVYDKYDPDPFFKSKRRMDNGGLSDVRTMEAWVDNNTLYLYANAPLQNLWGGRGKDNGSGEKFAPANDILSFIVEDGLVTYNQPFPRPFHEKAKDNFIYSGLAQAALLQGLRRQGIDTTGMIFEFK
jgi:hypothetical protein